MKRLRHFLFTTLCVLLSSTLLLAQTHDYSTYVIKPGETLSAIAKMKGTTVGDIMRLNKMNTQSILKVGETIKIPAKGVKVPASNAAAVETTNEVVPAETVSVKKVETVNATKHTVQKGESLYHLSKKYKVSLDELKKWNNLKTDAIKIGQVLNVSNPVLAVAAIEAAPEQPSAAAPKADKPLVKTVVKTPVIAKDTIKIMADHKDASKPIIIKEEKLSTTVTDTKPVETLTAQPAITANISPDGYFAPLFGQDVEGRSLQTSTGAAMTFKTTSGWVDKKYYILMNNIPPGSIVKITSSENKTVYAKVLWSLGDMKENEGLNYRISNATASALGITDAKFNLTVIFYE